MCNSPLALSDVSLQCGGKLQQLLSISLMRMSLHTVRCLPVIDLVVIGLVCKADPNGCRHTFLPSLRPYPVTGHRLL